MISELIDPLRSWDRSSSSHSSHARHTCTSCCPRLGQPWEDSLIGCLSVPPKELLEGHLFKTFGGLIASRFS